MKITKQEIRKIIREEIYESVNKDQKVWVGQTYQRDEESDDHREDHDLDDLYAMVRNLKREVEDLKGRK
jgi:molecular chaperone DnaK (HSP70)